MKYSVNNRLKCFKRNERFHISHDVPHLTDFEVLGLGLEGQVLGLGLEASSPRKLACPRLEDSSIF